MIINILVYFQIKIYKILVAKLHNHNKTNNLYDNYNTII